MAYDDDSRLYAETSVELLADDVDAVNGSLREERVGIGDILHAVGEMG